jgi:festuclavine dehydrogenase
MTILITGSTGKTSQALISQLQEAQIPHLIASRHPSITTTANNTVILDWNDPSTFSNPFNHPNGPVTAIYLVAPPNPNPAALLNPFLDTAAQYNVRRIVVIGGGSLTRKTPVWLGPVWQHLSEGPFAFAILRPAWFMQNLTTSPWVEAIRTRDELVTGAGATTPLPWVAVSDIAAVALHALRVSEDRLRETYDVKGAELASFADVATKLSSALGREVRVVEVGPEENAKRLAEGMPGSFATLVASLEEKHGNGQLAHIAGLEPNDTPEAIDREPITLDRFIEENKEVWL